MEQVHYGFTYQEAKTTILSDLKRALTRGPRGSGLPEQPGLLHDLGRMFTWIPLKEVWAVFPGPSLLSGGKGTTAIRTQI